MYKNTKVDLLLYTLRWQKKTQPQAQTDPLPPAPAAVYVGVSHKIFGRTGDAH